MILTDGGRAYMKILHSGDPVEKHAADELRKYIREMTDVDMALELFDETADAKNSVLIGAAAKLPESVVSGLGWDGFAIMTAPEGNLILAGAKPASSLYAVYAFLENYCGCGFFEDGCQIPRAEKLEIGDIDYKTAPHFKYRMFTTNCTAYYSGLNWWDEKQLCAWVDNLASKRVNLWLMEDILNSSGLLPLAFQRMGCGIRMTDFQEKRFEIVKNVVAYAKNAGIEVVNNIPNFSACSELSYGNVNITSVQLCEFVEAYNKTHDRPFPTFNFEWCGMKYSIFDSRSPEVKELIRNIITLLREVYGSSSWYQVSMPSEGGFSSEYSLEQTGKAVIEMFQALVDEIKELDPDAVILSNPPFAYAKTYEYQRAAVRSRDVIPFDYCVNSNRYYFFLMEDYFYGKQWFCGMLTHCSNETNPCGDIKTGVSIIKWIEDEPKADKCVGFIMQNEKCMRRQYLSDAFYKLGWEPKDVDTGKLASRYALRRYGSEYGEALAPAVKLIEESLYSAQNLGMINTPYYRSIAHLYLPGLAKESVKRHIGYLPAMRKALEIMLSVSDKLEDNQLFRFDIVDIGRTYLGAIFNLYFAGARIGGHNGDLRMVEEYSEKTLGLMRYIAKFVGAHPQFRLQTFYDWADRYPPARDLGPDYNRRAIMYTFTHMLDEFNETLSDYMAEDFSEIIEHYYLPRIKAYLDAIADTVRRGGITAEDVNTHVPNRRNDSAPPVGELLWSGFGPICESDLLERDLELRRSVFHREVISDPSLIYDGRITPLLREMLASYPLTDEPERLYALDVQGDTTMNEARDPILEVKKGDVVKGITMGVTVEKYDIPNEILKVFAIETLGTEYNTLRGSIERTKITADTFISFRRIEDGENTRRYIFDIGSGRYILEIDEGSDYRPCSLTAHICGKEYTR